MVVDAAMGGGEDLWMLPVQMDLCMMMRLKEIRMGPVRRAQTAQVAAAVVERVAVLLARACRQQKVVGQR